VKAILVKVSGIKVYSRGAGAENGIERGLLIRRDQVALSILYCALREGLDGIEFRLERSLVNVEAACSCPASNFP
jgi:hypothetical protein